MRHERFPDLQKILSAIQPIGRGLEAELTAHLNDLTKPPGSLGKLEEIILRLGLIQGTARPQGGKKIIFTLAGDHGVSEEGLSIAPKEVTRQMVLNMLAGGAAVNVLARHAGAEVRVVDVGVDFDFGGMPGLVHRKIRRGTGNIRKGPAMTPDEAQAAILVGVDLAKAAKEEGAVMIGTGEMGISNTTPTSALMAALLPCEVEDITGRGTGISDEALQRKIMVIREALTVNAGLLGDPLSALAAVGGLEIAGICGLALGGAACNLPVVIDGFISSAGALAACLLQPSVRDYLFFSHQSHERGHAPFLQKFGVEPILDLNMRLGEGTGAALAMTIIDAALKISNEMATFSGAGIAQVRDERQ